MFPVQGGCQLAASSPSPLLVCPRSTPSLAQGAGLCRAHNAQQPLVFNSSLQSDTPHFPQRAHCGSDSKHSSLIPMCALFFADLGVHSDLVTCVQLVCRDLSPPWLSKMASASAWTSCVSLRLDLPRATLRSLPTHLCLPASPA